MLNCSQPFNAIILKMDNEPQSHLITDSTGRITVRAVLPPGTQVDVLIEAVSPEGDVIETRKISLHGTQPPAAKPPLTPARWQPRLAERFTHAWSRIKTLRVKPTRPALFFALALLIYLLTRLIGIANFPIYFFTDEAIHVVQAQGLLDNGLRAEGELLPTFFQNGGQYNLGVSVYLQVLPSLLFTPTVGLTRGVCALISLLAAVCVGLTLKNIFNQRWYPLAVLLLALTPAWFLHSRTAFETSLAVSFYAAFLYFYGMYRLRSPRSLYPAVIFAGLAFYSYSPAQMVVGLTALLFFFSDLPYHWKQRKTVLTGLGLAALLALPYLRYLNLHPGENARHLQILDSYWVRDIPLRSKLGIYFGEYLKGLNPLYWYAPQPPDLVRHVMKGYGHVLWVTLPFMLAGLVSAVLRIRQSPYRALLIALLAAPSGAALAELGITRALFMVIPLCILTALGIDVLIKALARLRLPQSAAALGLFILLGGGSLFMLRDALVNGPTWYPDYGLAGMQYGARQLFAAADDYQAENPDDNLMVSAIWANGTDMVANYFYADEVPFSMGSLSAYVIERRPLDEHTVLVITPEEYDQVVQEPKFTDLRVLKTIPYPDGRPGFYFIKLRYADNADALFAAELENRRALLPADLILDGQPVKVQYSGLDMGKIESAFDGSLDTVIRTYAANPLRILLDFGQPRSLREVTVYAGGTPSRLTVTLYPADGSAEQVYTAEGEESPVVRPLTVTFTALNTARVQIDLLNVRDIEPAHVHLWEVEFK